MSVVDGNLKVYGIEGLRIADGSILPRVSTGNTMAPCVVIGERAAEILRTELNSTSRDRAASSLLQPVDMPLGFQTVRERIRQIQRSTLKLV
jgi:choline dehydrogenase-like flavoprotein